MYFVVWPIVLRLCVAYVARELDNLNAKLEVLKSIFETASGVSFKSTTLPRRTVNEVRFHHFIELTRKICFVHVFQEDLFDTLPDKLMKCKTSAQGLEDTVSLYVKF